MAASGAARLVLTKVDGRIFQLGVSTAATTVWVRTKALDIGDPSVRKALQRMLLTITERASLTHFTVTVSHADDKHGDFTEETAITLDTTAPINMRPRNSLFYKFLFKDEQVNADWKLSAIELFGTAAGRRV